MTLAADLRLSDRPLAELVSDWLDLEGAASPGVAVRERIVVPNTGGALAGTATTVEQPDLLLRVEVRGTDLGDRVRRTDALARWLSGRVHELTVPGERPGRVLRVMLAGPIVPRYWSAKLLHAGWDVDIPLRRLDAGWLDQEPVVRAIGTTPVPCPVGVLPSAPRVLLFGASTAVVDPVVRVTAADGREVAALGVTASLGATAYADVSCATGLLSLVTAGVAAAGVASLGGSDLPLLDPADAAPDAGVWPTVHLSATSGTPAGLLIYRRVW